MKTIRIANNVPASSICIGLVHVDGIQIGEAHPAIDEALESCIAERARGLSREQDAMRVACRRMLKHGSYRATGRGKPASEYLLKAAATEFPRINGPVDALNLVSLEHMVPISLWDVELAASRSYEVRLGLADEQYVFNATGQTLALRDLVCGCRIASDDSSEPIVTPIKDSQATKVTSDSSHLAAIIYFPASADRGFVDNVTKELSDRLLQCGARTSSWGVVEPDRWAQVQL